MKAKGWTTVNKQANSDSQSLSEKSKLKSHQDPILYPRYCQKFKTENIRCWQGCGGSLNLFFPSSKNLDLSSKAEAMNIHFHYYVYIQRHIQITWKALKNTNVWALLLRDSDLIDLIEIEILSKTNSWKNSIIPSI